MGDEAQHVHFEEATDGIKNNDIVVKQKSLKKIEIQLGFLQIHHVYEGSFVMSRSVFVADVAGYEQNDEPVPNINCRMVGIDQEGDNVVVEIKFKALKEKLVREKIVLKYENDEVGLEFVARVLGKGKGTPMLRSGIKCVEVQQDPEETEASDWQGFD
eukprot:GFUD01131991.1.p1 GENE.GFUD01131991.1~~GFUD01131991.1.p1  ORF type:complete len:158 (-),score=61.26 GFUD01131991.1:32-505(-)